MVLITTPCKMFCSFCQQETELRTFNQSLFFFFLTKEDYDIQNKDIFYLIQISFCFFFGGGGGPLVHYPIIFDPLKFQSQN